MKIKQADIEANAVSVEVYSLRELLYWLQYEKHTWTLCAGGIYLPIGLILMLVTLLAIVFTPYMLWHLFKAKWYKSIVVFLIIVVLPFIAFQILEIENEVLSYIVKSIPILTFYLYTNVISYVIGGHLNKVDTLKEIDFESIIRRRY